MSECACVVEIYIRLPLQDVQWLNCRCEDSRVLSVSTEGCLGQ